MKNALRSKCQRDELSCVVKEHYGQISSLNVLMMCLNFLNPKIMDINIRKYKQSLMVNLQNHKNTKINYSKWTLLYAEGKQNLWHGMFSSSLYCRKYKTSFSGFKMYFPSGGLRHRCTEQTRKKTIDVSWSRQRNVSVRGCCEFCVLHNA